MIPLQKPMVTKWLLSRQLPSGAILYSDTKVNPYFGHIAAIGLAHEGQVPAALAWAKWCFANWSWPDKYGLHGTMYDFSVEDTTTASLGSMDSVDSYAALWLVLMQALWDTGSPEAFTFIKSKSYELDVLGGILVQSMDTADGLTWAKPDYKIKYLMDNCEVYAGFASATYLYTKVFHDSAKSAYYLAMAQRTLDGINSMRLGPGKLAVYKDANGKMQVPNTNTWYPDLLSQFYPLYYDLPLTYRLYLTCSIDTAQQDWSQLLPASRFPAVLCAVAMSRMGDVEGVDRYLTKLHSAGYFVKQQWPWYCAEAGWYLCL